VCYLLKFLDAEKRKHLVVVAMQKKNASSPSAKDKKLKGVAEVAKVAPSEDDETCSGLVFKRKRKVDAAIQCPHIRMDELPPTGNVPLAPPLPAPSWCKRVEVKTLRRETNGILLLICLPSCKRCCDLPELRKGWTTWMMTP